MKIGEPLPLEGDAGFRMYRMGHLAAQLVERGHEVTWWASTFDHQEKRHRFQQDTIVPLSASYRIRLLHSRGYARNVSIGRVLDHREVARKFRTQAMRSQRPDVILCSLPAPILCREAVRYGRARGVPVVIDVRDLWPDVFYNLVPLWARRLAQLALWPMRLSVLHSCALASAITGPTEAYVQWGVRHAGRAKTDMDAVFPFGYSSKTPPDDAVRAARKFWQALGLHGGGEDFVACFFGRIGYQFDLETVIQAARKLREVSTQFKFVLCGTGDRLDRFKGLAAGLDNVLFPGWMDQVHIWTLMRMSSVGLAPYRNSENFRMNVPNKPIEYFSAGLPVISSLGGLLMGILDRHGCGVRYGVENAEQLVSILTSLRDDPARLARMSDNATRLFEREYVAGRVYGKMAAHLVRVAEKTPAPR